MIIFDLKCDPQGHVFEAWFGSSADYEEQGRRGLLCCPICGSAQVGKAPMAPQVGPKGNARSDVSPAATKAMLAEMAKLQKKMLEQSDFVGDRFPDEARAIHLGEAEARAIHGRASRADAESLAEEGIPVSPLPFPVPEPGEEN
ncbi:MAG TPA: DUF1178 family protein [Allosphingosinicella sp.]|nr:DUF1178 family protein [Allosphingosinicella sp.]